MIKRYLIIIFCCNITFAQVSDFESIDFRRADNIVKLHEGQSLNNLPILAHKLTHQLTSDVEKFRAIYLWVCLNIKGDVKQNNIVMKNRKKLQNDSISYLRWNADYKKDAFKKLLKHKKTMCTGYAALIKELCFLANIDCEIIDGYGRNLNSNVDSLEMTNHSWNAIKLNNKWYLCDATWSSGYSINNRFIKDYNNGYFLTDPILFANNHYPIDEKWLLNDTSTTTKFVSAPLVYGKTFEHNILPISPSEMHIVVNKGEEINFSFETTSNIPSDKIFLVSYNNTKLKEFKIYDLEINNELVQFKYTFNNKGFYDIHVKIDKDIVATYTIKII